MSDLDIPSGAGHPRPELVVADRALAVIAAVAATRTSGVAGLQPFARSAALAAVSTTARRMGARLGAQFRGGGESGGLEAVSVERSADASVTVVVRIVTAAARPVRDVAGDVARRVTAAVRSMADVEAAVSVQVVDIGD